MAVGIEWLILLAAVFWALYKYSTRNHQRFKKNGIPYKQPVPFFGNIHEIIFQKTHIYEFTKSLYNIAKTKGLGGYYDCNKPQLVLGTPELVKKLTIKDFDYFTDHRAMSHEDDILSKSIVMSKGQKWRKLRTAFSPVFTGNKIRIMFDLISNCAQQVDVFLKKKYLEGVKNAKDSKNYVYELEMKDFFTRFTNDAIATAAFGIEVDSLANPDNEFYRMGKDFTDLQSGFRWVKFIFLLISERLLKLFWPQGILSQKAIKYFRQIFQDSYNQRKNGTIIRPDLINLMLEINNNPMLENSLRLSEEDIFAQCTNFFFGGFDTIANSLSLITYLLAQHTEVQKKVHQEIDQILEKYGTNINYDIIMNEMSYLEMVFNESQRYYPQAPILERVCTKKYTIPADKNHPEYTLIPGEQIVVPVIGFHRDPQYFYEPDKFIPERFSEENKHLIDQSVFMPFGIGPRMCIANRFAKMETKLVLFHLFKNFEICFTKKTDCPLKFTNKSFFIVTENGYWLGAKPRKDIK